MAEEGSGIASPRRVAFGSGEKRAPIRAMPDPLTTRSPSRSALQSGRDPYHVNVLNADTSSVNRAHPGSKQLEPQFRWGVDQESSSG